MLNIEYITANKLKDNDELEYTVDLLLAYNTVDSDGYPDIEKMEVQVFPISKKTKIGDRMFVTSIGKRSSNYETFDLVINHKDKKATFFHWDIILPEDVRNCGVGRYAMSKLIDWGNKRVPEYIVGKLKLSSVDAGTDEQRDLRNSFYEKLGFKLHFPNDETKRDGYCDAPSLSDLNASYNEKKIIVKEPADVIYQQQWDLVDSLEKQDHMTRSSRERLNDWLELNKKYNTVRLLLFGSIILVVVYVFY